MSHHRTKPDAYEARLHDYLEREVHPETAKNIGEIVFRSPLGSSEFAMSIILQMQLDPIRKDRDLESPHFDNVFVYKGRDQEGEALPPVS